MIMKKKASSNVIQRAVAIIRIPSARAGRGLQPIKHASDDTMTELKTYQDAVKERISAADFARTIIEIELHEWERMQKTAAQKMVDASAAKLPALDRLNDIALGSVARYKERHPQLIAIIEELNKTLDRVTAAISVLEIDQNLRSVSNMFTVDGFEKMNFNMQKETEEIRRLCYTADAFLELET
jgi:hypothetical protein